MRMKISSKKLKVNSLWGTFKVTETHSYNDAQN